MTNFSIENKIKEPKDNLIMISYSEYRQSYERTGGALVIRERIEIQNFSSEF